jgi:Lar family restriction alleviation protein
MKGDMKELKPCPFCGATDMLAYDPSFRDKGPYMIECYKCGIILRLMRDNERKVTRENIVKAWNRREEI